MAKIIKNISPKQRQIETSDVMESLGAERVGVKIDTRKGPITLFFLRQFLINQLRSKGGRPGLEGTTKNRKKIPLFEKDWEKLVKIAKYFKEEEGINVSPGQIASSLIHNSILKIDENAIS